jgi:hypothetical protein
MVLSETIQYITVLAVTIFFSAFAFVIEKEMLQVVLKVIAGVCWFSMAVTQFYFFGGSQLFAVPSTIMFFGIGIVYIFSIVYDFKQENKDKIWNFGD